MVRFYGAHVRLQFSSIPLQGIRIREVEGIHAMKPFWLSYNSALAILELINKSSSMLYLAQNSIHVMTAYAAIFLVKFLLSSPPAITQEIELEAAKAISDAANTFAGLSAPSSSSCAT
ncbi:uncharacterized protein BDV17DRAFT_295218 [Aspergillus undulatus]|uniref:uncharacterized protein n=1 Tax=Aspergillus undulatus TaxID=1810928 RepID=UPI003CCD2E86